MERHYGRSLWPNPYRLTVIHMADDASREALHPTALNCRVDAREAVQLEVVRGHL